MCASDAGSISISSLAQLRICAQLAAIAAEQEINETEKRGRREKGGVVMGWHAMCRAAGSVSGLA